MLVRRIRNAILKPWRKVAAFDEYESPVPVGLIGEADFGIRSAPGILLVQSAHHLSGKAFNRAIGSFEKLQHLLVDLCSMVANRDPGELGIDGREVDAFDRNIRIDRRTIAKFVIDGVGVGARNREFRDIGERRAPCEVVIPMGIVGHGDGGCRPGRAEEERAETHSTPHDVERGTYRRRVGHGLQKDRVRARYHGCQGDGNSSLAFL